MTQELRKIEIAVKPHVREGIAFTFSGEELDADKQPISEFVAIELIVPPLNLDSLRELGPRLSTMQTDGDEKGFATMLDAMASALKRNYRGVPRWLLEQSIDVANMAEFTQAFMDTNGLRRKAVEEGKAAAVALTQSTGARSIVS